MEVQGLPADEYDWMISVVNSYLLPIVTLMRELKPAP